MSNWSILQALVFEPRKAFAALRDKPVFWFPLLALMLATFVVQLWYLTKVDTAWLTDMQLRSSALVRGALTDQQIQERAAMAAGRAGLSAGIGSVGGALAVALVMAVSALYFSLASKITNVPGSFRHWFSMACWTAMPTLLAVLPAVFLLATATTTQIPPADLQPLSINALFLDLKMGDPGYTLFTSMNLTSLLSIWLAAVGVKEWSKRSWLFSVVFVALPTVLLYGIWAYFALGRS